MDAPPVALRVRALWCLDYIHTYIHTAIAPLRCGDEAYA